MNNLVYNRKFYLKNQNPSTKSAQEILPLLFKLFKPNNVIDIGCGIGTWLYQFNKMGIEDVVGIDGDYVDKDLLMIDKKFFLTQDLNEYFGDIIKRKFDLAISLEVAEHIEYKNARNFITSLVNYSDVILFSAAVPYQGGDYHVNENWIEYWSLLFKEHNFSAVDYFRNKIWHNNEIEVHYRQNIMLYIKKDKINKIIINSDFEEQIPNTYIHPELFLSMCRNKVGRSKIHKALNYYKNLLDNYDNIDRFKKYTYNKDDKIYYSWKNTIRNKIKTLLNK